MKDVSLAERLLEFFFSLGQPRARRRHAKRVAPTDKVLARMMSFVSGAPSLERGPPLRAHGRLRKGAGGVTVEVVHDTPEALDLRVSVSATNPLFLKLGRKTPGDHSISFVPGVGRDPASEDAANLLLKRPGGRGLVLLMFLRFAIETVESRDGALETVVRVGRDDRGTCRAVAVALARLARMIERRAGSVELKPDSVHVSPHVSAHPVVVSATGARCSYCHDAIDGDEPDLRPCERCATVLHEACWEELGRCPVLGCGGKAGDAKVREPG